MKHPENLTDKYLKKVTAKKRNFSIPGGVPGLTLFVSEKGCKTWRYWYQFDKKPTQLSLGRWPVITADMAYQQATNAQLMIYKSIDPKRHKQKLLMDSQSHIFEEVASEFHRIWSGNGNWNAAHTHAIERLLDEHVLPTIGKADIKDIDATLIVSIIRTTQTKATTGVARRVSQILGQIFRYAHSNFYCHYNPMPATADMLPPRKTQHRPAIIDIHNGARLMRGIKHFGGNELAKALIFLQAYLFCRPIELRSLEWKHVDLGPEQRIVLPASLMKGNQDHIIPLSTQCFDILKQLHAKHGHLKYVFHGQREHLNTHISEHVIRAALKKIKISPEEHTAHGFRATARTFLDERLGFPVPWIEKQLAHTVYDANGQAYSRGIFLEDRVKMMQAYADFLDGLAEQPV